MTYQVLARKWRPKRFADLVGQEHVVRALSNALRESRLHHAYLLTGTRGVGKTTIARILAKSLNCETGTGAEPCGECQACRQIDSGRYVDLLEIDAASNTGIDNIREVLENAQYAPTMGRFKVYIIDEVHMLSKSAFNAMLKTLEEPPAHVKFILATTDPQKVPVTVLSRCLQFSLRNMTPQQVAGHLAHVLDAEGVVYETPALALLGRAAAGSMRDALSLLDQAIAYGVGEVREDGVRAMLGAVDKRYLFVLLDALADGDGAQLMAEVETLAARGIGFDNALAELASLLHQLALAQTVPDAIASDEPERDVLFALAQRIGAEDIQLYYQIALHGRRDLALAPDEHAGFSMTMLRMLAFHPLHAGESAARPLPSARPQGSAPAPQAAPSVAAPSAGASPVKALLAQMSGKSERSVPSADKAPAAEPEPEPARPAAAPAAEVARPVAPPPPPSPAPRAATVTQAAPPEAPPPWEEQPVAAPVAQPVRAPERPVAATPPAVAPAAPQQEEAGDDEREPEPEETLPSYLMDEDAELAAYAQGDAAAASGYDTPRFDGDWAALIGTLSARMGTARMLAQNAVLKSWNEQIFELAVPEAFRNLAGPDYQNKLKAVLSAHLGREVQLRVSVETLDMETPAMRDARARREQQAAARQYMENDPLVQQLVRDMGAMLLAETIQPVQE
ncbi:DNA polymerase III subunit gamma/tau [Vogesella sp. LIG4]|uniref:DNA polymerase III subunit gamma/tau n=1 Tax=Vogesella sp. LIG4 TaxID=1192162 RepID=UPI00081F839F|nr:DNA polymerase III subunit gamma/tau [Vogesella sp. LIG4]SCK21371.1 DNA polymerase-3 subunit gamma/tau [Vogesella sp. LIG4]